MTGQHADGRDDVDLEARISRAVTELSTPRRRRIEYELERGEHTDADSVAAFVRAAAEGYPEAEGGAAALTVDELVHAAGVALMKIDREVAQDVPVHVDVPPELFARAWLRYRTRLVREDAPDTSRNADGLLEDYLQDFLRVYPEFTLDGRLPDAVSLLTAGDDVLGAQSAADGGVTAGTGATPAITSEADEPASGDADDCLACGRPLSAGAGRYIELERTAPDDGEHMIAGQVCLDHAAALETVVDDVLQGTPTAIAGGEAGVVTVEETSRETIRRRHAAAADAEEIPVTLALPSRLVEAVDHARDCEAGESIPQFLAGAAYDHLLGHDDVPAHLLEGDIDVDGRDDSDDERGGAVETIQGP